MTKKRIADLLKEEVEKPAAKASDTAGTAKAGEKKATSATRNRMRSSA